MDELIETFNSLAKEFSKSYVVTHLRVSQDVFAALYAECIKGGDFRQPVQNASVTVTVDRTLRGEEWLAECSDGTLYGVMDGKQIRCPKMLAKV